MLNDRSMPKSGENAWVWLLKILSGVLVVVFLFIHLVVNHLVAPEGLLSYREVVEYLSNPWITLMEASFLVIVVSHSLLGTRSILLDLNPSASFKRVMDWFLTAVGIVAIGYGIWLLRTIVSQV